MAGYDDLIECENQRYEREQKEKAKTFSPFSEEYMKSIIGSPKISPTFDIFNLKKIIKDSKSSSDMKKSDYISEQVRLILNDSNSTQEVIDRVNKIKPFDITEKSIENPGYHVTEISKGEFGEPSKIIEEVLEFEDALHQKSDIMALIELSDLLGAISGYLAKYHPSLKLEDLIKFSDITQRAFRNGYRS